MKFNLYLFFILVLGLFLRLYNLDLRGPFTDEKFSLLNANGFWVGAANQKEITNKKYFTPSDFWTEKSMRDFFEAVAHSDFGTHIIHNALLHPWMKFFGNSDYSIRFLSVLFGFFSMLFIYWMVKKITQSNLSALVSTFLLAVEPLNVAQSHIARSYTLSFFIVLLSTYLFIKILTKPKSLSLLFILYSFLVGLGMLNHYLNFLVPLSHGLTFLLVKKDLKLWIGFGVAAVFNSLLMLWWFTKGGGYLAMDFLKDKNLKHLKVALSGDGLLSDVIQVSTPELVIKKAISLFYDSSVLSHGLYSNINGVKNFLISLAVFGLIISLTKYWKNQKTKMLILLLPILIGLLFIARNNLIGIFISNIFYGIIFWFVYSYIFKTKQNTALKSLALVCLFMFIIPIVFVIYDAFKNGHTTSLTHRYIGVSSPFVAILCGLGVFSFYKNMGKINIVLIFLVVFQGNSIIEELKLFFEDKSVKYAWYDPSRSKNPYKKLADEIKLKYMEGDTLVIPSYSVDVYTEILGSKNQVSFTDAQYLNLYLPKDSKIIQRIDPKESNKVFLVSKNGEKSLLFDFEGLKYRY